MSRRASGRHSGPPDRPAPGGRPPLRRPDPTVLLAVLLPVAVLVAALLIDTTTVRPGDRAPGRTDLASATLVCPGGAEGAQVGATTVEPDVRGRLQVGAERVPLATGRVTTLTDDEPLVLVGEGPAAPGLVATRSAGAPPAAIRCAPPLADGWFTGVGSATGLESVLELVNPGAGPAVVEVRLHSARGVVDAPDLRGITVPGGRTVQVPLAERVPRRGELALHVVTSRGRVGATVRSTRDELGGGPRASDWLAAQTEPATENLLVGVPEGQGEQVLVLANPGDDEVRAQVRLVTAESSFAPEGLSEVRVPPAGVARVAVAQEVASAGDVLALRVEGSGPLVATLRSFVDGDLAHTPAGERVEGPVAVVVPQGAKRLVLAGAVSTGAVTWIARSADGQRLGRERVEVVPDRGVEVALPAAARLVEVVPHDTGVVASVVLAGPGPGVAVLRLREPVRVQLVPDVRPGLR